MSVYLGDQFQLMFVTIYHDIQQHGKVWVAELVLHRKDERGGLDHRGSPDRTMQPRPDLGHGPYFAKFWGQSGLGSRN